VREGYAYAGILVVDRPGEGPWVSDLWRDPDPAYAGAGSALLRWAAARLDGFGSLGLVVTVGNDRALRAYERVGFTIESTTRTVRLP
jgi:ribosomal protein S18 acetylase RimI-like enzyme